MAGLNLVVGTLLVVGAVTQLPGTEFGLVLWLVGMLLIGAGVVCYPEESK